MESFAVSMAQLNDWVNKPQLVLKSEPPPKQTETNLGGSCQLSIPGQCFPRFPGQSMKNKTYRVMQEYKDR